MSSKVRLIFTPEQKLKYARLMVDEGYTNKQIMKMSGVGNTTVSRWKKQYLIEFNDQTPDNKKVLPHKLQTPQHLERQTDLLVFFSSKESELSKQYSDLFKIKHFKSFLDWKVQRVLPLAFVIEEKETQYTSSILAGIRRDKEAFAFLCFVSDSDSKLNNHLADGQLPPPQLLQKEIVDMLALEKSFKNNETIISNQERLIKYLWLRPNLVLQPYHEWQNPRFYRYPLLEALSNDESDTFDWLRTLSNAKILEPLDLIDRQRECTHCSSSHLSFVDICPNCQSIDIELQSFLHCYACGCVEPQKKFIHNGMLVCPKCNTQLRHIGSDYDRPIDDHACCACQQSFVESDVVARCAMCEKEMKPDELVSNSIKSWKLSNKGHVIAIRGEVFDITSSFDVLNFIPSELFVHDLNWLLVSSQRYPETYFSLFGIYFENLSELSVIIGYSQLLRILESFSEKLRALLRTPDLSTRFGENMLWLLLPHTDEKGLLGFQARIENNLDLIQQNNKQKLYCSFTSITSTQIPDKENAELLLARLYGELT